MSAAVGGFSELLGTSPVMERVRTLLQEAAPSPDPLLLVGEPGTGKRFSARMVHAQSACSAGAFVSLHCAALPDHLFASGTFGPSGALSRAGGGTLFLEELGALSLESQALVSTFLRDTRRQPRVRLLVSMHRSPLELVRRREFSEELAEQLSALSIVLPPLRERPGDLELLARHFVAKHERTFGSSEVAITSGAMAQLAARNWPGNVRQLEHVLEVFLMTHRGVTVIDEAKLSARSSPR